MGMINVSSFARVGSVRVPRLMGSLLAAAAFALLPTARLVGAVQSSTITITLTNPGICTVTASPLNFPNYTGAQTRATTTLSVMCSTSIPYNIALSPGLSPGATVTTRMMTAGAATVGYALFRDSAYLLNWGQTAGTDTVPGSGQGGPVSVTVYGQIAAGQNGVPGVYSDTVTATVSY
jgi:spore coat protein U-like protein